jgi:hypothetical protein
MEKGDLVRTMDSNGEIRDHGLFMESFIPNERGLSYSDMDRHDERAFGGESRSYDLGTMHFEVFIDGNVRYLNAVYWSLLPVSND